MFYIAYTQDGAAADKRPITFTYNGGPGFASALVDIGGFGPVHIPWTAPGDIRAEQPPYRLVPNPTSILKSTDLVFIDAVGTGYSRIVGKGKPKDFYGVSRMPTPSRNSSSATSVSTAAGIRPSSCWVKATAPPATRCWPMIW